MVKRRERPAPKPAWRRRVEVLRDVRRQLRTFKPENPCAKLCVGDGAKPDWETEQNRIS